MKTRSLVCLPWVAVLASAIVVLEACAAAEDAPPAELDAKENTTSTPDSGLSTPDSGLEATAEDAGVRTCTDCAYFSDRCSPDVLCMNGPFGSDGPDGGLDWRTQINVIRGRSVSDVWAVGALGAIAHFDGTSWERSDPGTRATMRALWLRDSEEISFVTLEHIYARGLPVQDAASPSSGGWIAQDPPSTPSDYNPLRMKFTSAWAAPGAEWLWSTTAAWGPGDAMGLWRLRLSSSATFEIDSVAPEDDPQCASLGCSQMTSIHGASANTLWAVGFRGAIVRISGAESDRPRIDAFNSRTWNTLHGVWAASEQEAWSVGVGGVIRRYTGDPLVWDIVSNVPTTEDLNAVWGSSSSDVWAVGNASVVLHYDGKSWSRVHIAGLGARRPNLYTVWVPAPGHVWVGGQGVVFSLGGKP